MVIIDNELTQFIKLINLMLPEHGDIALIDDDSCQYNVELTTINLQGVFYVKAIPHQTRR